MLLLLIANETERTNKREENAKWIRERGWWKKDKLFILFVDAIYFNHIEMCRFNRSQGNNVVMLCVCVQACIKNDVHCNLTRLSSVQFSEVYYFDHNQPFRIASFKSVFMCFISFHFFNFHFVPLHFREWCSNSISIVCDHYMFVCLLFIFFFHFSPLQNDYAYIY